jgi:hypothetical protein
LAGVIGKYLSNLVDTLDPALTLYIANDIGISNCSVSHKDRGVEMAIDLITFRWRVPSDGYKWVEERVLESDGDETRPSKRPEWALTTGRPWNAEYMAKHYSPLSHFPAMFRTFADLPFDDRDAILAFANEHGDLGIGKQLHVTEEGDPNALVMMTGETHQDWALSIFRLREAVALWDLLRSRDVTGLARHLRWEPKAPRADGWVVPRDAWHYDSHPDLPRDRPVFPQRRSQLVFQKFEELPLTPGDLLTPASVLIQEWVNEQLEGKAMPRLLHHLGLGRLVMQIVPNSLLTAMWLQLAHAIAGSKQYRACKECAGWFEISGDDDGRTARRLFCSDPCKSRDYRRRKERVVALKAAGRTPKQIAGETDTDLETVQKWLKANKGRN